MARQSDGMEDLERDLTQSIYQFSSLLVMLRPRDVKELRLQASTGDTETKRSKGKKNKCEKSCGVGFAASGRHLHFLPIVRVVVQVECLVRNLHRSKAMGERTQPYTFECNSEER